MKIISRILIALSILGSILACQSGSSSVEVSLTSFAGSELEGIWQAQYGLYRGVEILVFNKDGTYLQIYEDAKGLLDKNDTHTWEIKKYPSGRVFVHLKDGLWFPHGAQIARQKGMDSFSLDSPHPYYDHKTKKIVTMLNELILEVIPRANSKGFVLFHFASDIDLAPEHFEPTIK